jgi:hypothetical protein
MVPPYEGYKNKYHEQVKIPDEDTRMSKRWVVNAIYITGTLLRIILRLQLCWYCSWVFAHAFDRFLLCKWSVCYVCLLIFSSEVLQLTIVRDTIYLALPTRAGSPQQHMPITVGPFCLTHPVNFPCGRKPEYPEEIHDFRQSVAFYAFRMRTGFESHWESSHWDLNLPPQRWKASALTTWPPKPLWTLACEQALRDIKEWWIFRQYSKFQPLPNWELLAYYKYHHM